MWIEIERALKFMPLEDMSVLATQEPSVRQFISRLEDLLVNPVAPP